MSDKISKLPRNKITTEKEYDSYQEMADMLFDKNVNPERIDGEYLKDLLLMIKEYEDINFIVPPPDPNDVGNP